MNSIHLPAYRQPRVRLADDRAFRDVPEISNNIGAINPEKVAARLTARHCAGLWHCSDGPATLRYLLGETEGTQQMEAAIRSLLNRCSGMDALHLATLCRVPIRRLAHCARKLEVTNWVLIRFLNQFATPTAAVGQAHAPEGASPAANSPSACTSAKDC